MNHMKNNNNVDRKYEKQKLETQTQLNMRLKSLKISSIVNFKTQAVLYRAVTALTIKQ